MKLGVLAALDQRIGLRYAMPPMTPQETAGRRRWSTRWKPALTAFDIAFDGRLSASRK